MIKMLKGNCIVGQSGGPSSVINASLAGVIDAALKASEIETVYGARHGIEGVLSESFVNLTEYFEGNDKLETLKVTPAAFLGSCRHKLPKEFNETFEKIFTVFKKMNITYFFYIGGNDSMDTVHKLSTYAKMIDYPINIIGVPKTIDNDLAVTDHTPGFGSAAKYIAASVREIILDSKVYDFNTVTIIEIMGRNAGWLTAAAAMARTENEPAPHLIYLPEFAFDPDQFMKDVEDISKDVKNVIVVISEGVKYANGKYVCEGQGQDKVDSFGHKQLSGTARVLADMISQKHGWKVRPIEFSLLQRCASHLSSKTDRDEAFAIGKAGVAAALKGETGMMMYYKRVSDAPYTIEMHSHDISTIANVEKVVPREWVNEKCNDVLQPCIDYMLPLIQGECEIKYENGTPVYLKL